MCLVYDKNLSEIPLKTTSNIWQNHSNLYNNATKICLNCYVFRKKSHLNVKSNTTLVNDPKITDKSGFNFDDIYKETFNFDNIIILIILIFINSKLLFLKKYWNAN